MVNIRQYGVAVLLLAGFAALPSSAQATKVETGGHKFTAEVQTGGVTLAANNGAGPTFTCSKSKFKGEVPAAGANKRNTYDGGVGSPTGGGSVVIIMSERPSFSECSSAAFNNVTVTTAGTWYYDWYSTKSGTNEVYIAATAVPDSGIQISGVATEKKENCEAVINEKEAEKEKTGGTAQPLLGDWANGTNSGANSSTWKPMNQLEFTTNCAALTTPFVFSASYSVKDIDDATKPIKVSF